MYTTISQISICPKCENTYEVSEYATEWYCFHLIPLRISLRFLPHFDLMSGREKIRCKLIRKTSFHYDK